MANPEQLYQIRQACSQAAKLKETLAHLASSLNGTDLRPLAETSCVEADALQVGIQALRRRIEPPVKSRAGS